MEKRGVYRPCYSPSPCSAKFSFSPKRSQVGAEFLIIMAFVLIILLSLIALNQGLLDSLTGQMRGERGRIVVNDLVDAAESVYFQGVGAQTRILISVPSGVSFSQVSNRTIRMGLSDRSGNQNDIYRNTNFVVAGFIPTEEGNHWITVRAMPGYVLIGYGLIEVSPSGIARMIAPGNSSVDTIYIRNAAGEDVDVLLSIEIDSEVSTMLSSSEFLLPMDGNATTDLTLSVPSSTGPGIYSGRLIILANTSTDSQTLYLPITVSVVYGSCNAGCPLIQIFPKLWNLGIAGYNRLYSTTFFVCSGFNTTQNVALNFTNTSLVGFNPSINQKTKTISVGAGNCSTTLVYVNTTLAPEGDYDTLLLASASGESDFARILFQVNYSGDQLPPVVNLMWPPNNYTVNSTNLLFSYNVSDLNNSIAYCNLIIDGATVAVNSSVSENVAQYFRYGWLSSGVHNWTVGCADTSPNANYGVADARRIIVNTTTICVSPAQIYEEDFDPQWTTEVAYENDGLYAIASDEGSSITHLDYPPPDYVQMDFPSMGVSSSYAVDTAILYYRHMDYPLGGWFDVEDRHQIECYNGREWVVMGNYSVSDGDWTMLETPDMSTCISTAEIANDVHLRVTFDPADTIGGYQYIDLVKVCVNMTDGYYVFLWPMAVDSQRIVDFYSGLNTTANTWGIGGSNDGWDWNMSNPYGGDVTGVSVFNADPNMDGSTSDSTVGTNKFLEVMVGGRPGGSENNPQDVKITGPVASAAYGVMFNLTPQLFNLINASGKRAYVVFDWWINENPWEEDRTLDDSDEGWVKARLTTRGETIWLGYDLDHGYADADPYNDIWFAYDPFDDSGHAYFDVTDYFTYSGYYYLEVGIAVGDWDNEKEGLGGRFDNMAVVIR